MTASPVAVEQPLTVAEAARAMRDAEITYLATCQTLDPQRANEAHRAVVSAEVDYLAALDREYTQRLRAERAAKQARAEADPVNG